MTSFLCEQAIDFDAQQNYHTEDVEKLISQIQSLCQSVSGRVVVLLRNAHYLTTKAFAVLYAYVQQRRSSNVIFILSGDKTKIFPPLLEYLA